MSKSLGSCLGKAELALSLSKDRDDEKWEKSEPERIAPEGTPTEKRRNEFEFTSAPLPMSTRAINHHPR